MTAGGAAGQSPCSKAFAPSAICKPGPAATICSGTSANSVAACRLAQSENGLPTLVVDSCIRTTPHRCRCRRALHQSSGRTRDRIRRHTQHGNPFPVLRRPSRRPPLTAFPDGFIHHGSRSFPLPSDRSSRRRCFASRQHHFSSAIHQPAIPLALVPARLPRRFAAHSAAARSARPPPAAQKQLAPKGLRQPPGGLVPALALPHPRCRRPSREQPVSTSTTTPVGCSSVEPDQLDPSYPVCATLGSNTPTTPSLNTTSSRRTAPEFCAQPRNPTRRPYHRHRRLAPTITPGTAPESPFPLQPRQPPD